jgi:hypothetical protein
MGRSHISPEQVPLLARAIKYRVLRQNKFLQTEKINENLVEKCCTKLSLVLFLFRVVRICLIRNQFELHTKHMEPKGKKMYKSRQQEGFFQRPIHMDILSLLKMATGQFSLNFCILFHFCFSGLEALLADIESSKAIFYSYDYQTGRRSLLKLKLK